MSDEAELAEKLKDWVESTFAGQVEVFVSSVYDDLPAGSKWLDKIDSALDSCEILLILCSPRSIYRPWVNFEAGCGWIKRVPIVPICHSGLAVSSLPQPLGSFQALALSDDRFPDKLIRAIAKQFKINKLPKIRPEDMKADLDAAVAKVSSQEVVQTPAQVAASGSSQPWNVTTSEVEPHLQSFSNFRYSVKERTKPRWKISWQIEVFNKTRGPARYRVDCTFHDADGFPLDKAASLLDTLISPNEQKTLKDYWSIPAEKAVASTEMQITVKRRPGP